MKDELLLLRNQLKMGHRISFAEAMLLQRAIDILVNKAGNLPVIGIDLASGQDRTVEVSYVAPPGYVMVPKDLLSDLRDWAHPEIEKYCEMWEGRRDSEFPALRKVIADADALLAAAPQPQNAQQNIPEIIPGWIPVSERMPDDDDFVYIWPRPDFGVELHVGQYCECSPKGDGWYAQVYEQNYGIEWHPITVTHWMPLPNPPKEEK
ncbi:DUF551 domain-containing protein [Klebsiella pneumoniae]|uniref:DUF551 domain-containing protein n=1 Tax=Klebsiella pneumoniae TaxID=573 RepID=UPI0010ECD248|nr:DUF551 domain-containing protein [Klebsiella pneumoniae]VGD57670.1 Protein of uncharacterised function (DUF551) [Klebsiella pneumoniae]